jgi:hypothetical protein
MTHCRDFRQVLNHPGLGIEERLEDQLESPPMVGDGGVLADATYQAVGQNSVVGGVVELILD